MELVSLYSRAYPLTYTPSKTHLDKLLMHSTGPCEIGLDVVDLIDVSHFRIKGITRQFQTILHADTGPESGTQEDL
jgi:hypothetical protein